MAIPSIGGSESPRQQHRHKTLGHNLDIFSVRRPFACCGEKDSLYKKPMRLNCSCFVFHALAVVAFTSMDVCHAQQRSGPPSFAVSPDKSNGVYQVGETIRWRIEATGTNAALSAHYSLKKGEMVEVAQGDLMLTNGIAELESKADAPGHLMLEVRPSVTGGRGSRVLGGVIIAPEKITLSAPRPADFDSFWDGKLKEMKQVPARAKLERAEAGRTQSLRPW